MGAPLDWGIGHSRKRPRSLQRVAEAVIRSRPECGSVSGSSTSAAERQCPRLLAAQARRAGGWVDRRARLLDVARDRAAAEQLAVTFSRAMRRPSRWTTPAPTPSCRCFAVISAGSEVAAAEMARVLAPGGASS